MSTASRAFRESNLFAAPIRDLKLSIDQTPLAPIIDEFLAELRAKGITRLVPRFHLSTEWGVPFGTVVIGIPFYLARPELTELHGEEVGHIEGLSRHDILRYLRHEMGHVVNYALQAVSTRKRGSSCSARSRSRTWRTIGRSRSAGGTCGICRAGMRRSIPTRIGPRRLPCG